MESSQVRGISPFISSKMGVLGGRAGLGCQCSSSAIILCGTRVTLPNSTYSRRPGASRKGNQEAHWLRLSWGTLVSVVVVVVVVVCVCVRERWIMELSAVLNLERRLCGGVLVAGLGLPAVPVPESCL